MLPHADDNPTMAECRGIFLKNSCTYIPEGVLIMAGVAFRPRELGRFVKKCSDMITEITTFKSEMMNH